MKNFRETGRDAEGRTALWWACANGHASTVALLLDFGADAMTLNELGVSAFTAAVREGHDGDISYISAPTSLLW